jgi:hypothetical protein
MEDIFVFFFFLSGVIGYIVVCYFIIRFISNLLMNANYYLRIVIISFLSALFLGIGIAGTGGEPGFGFPAPNILALILMLSLKNYNGVIVGLYVFGSWWIIICISKLIWNSLVQGKPNQD